MHNIGRLIKDKREELGMTQEELAHRVGYKSRASINKIELQRDVPLKKVRPIAEVLDIDIHSLVGFDGFEIAEEKYSRDNAAIVAKVRNDRELIDTLRVYFSLPDDKRKLALGIIRAMANEVP